MGVLRKVGGEGGRRGNIYVPAIELDDYLPGAVIVYFFEFADVAWDFGMGVSESVPFWVCVAGI